MIGLILVSAVLSTWFTAPTSNEACTDGTAVALETPEITPKLEVAIKATITDATSSLAHLFEVRKGADVLGSKEVAAGEIVQAGTVVNIPITDLTKIGDGTGLKVHIKEKKVDTFADCGDEVSATDLAITTAESQSVSVLATGKAEVTFTAATDLGLVPADTLQLVDGVTVDIVPALTIADSKATIKFSVDIDKVETMMGKLYALKVTTTSTTKGPFFLTPIVTISTQTAVEGYAHKDKDNILLKNSLSNGDKVVAVEGTNVELITIATAGNPLPLAKTTADAYYFVTTTSAAPYKIESVPKKIAALPAAPALGIAAGEATEYIPVATFTYSTPHPLNQTTDKGTLFTTEVASADVTFTAGVGKVAFADMKTTTTPEAAYFYHEVSGLLISQPLPIPAAVITLTKSTATDTEVPMSAAITMGTVKDVPGGIICAEDGVTDYKTKGKFYAFAFNNTATTPLVAKVTIADFKDHTKAVKCFVTPKVASEIPETVTKLSAEVEAIAAPGGSAAFTAVASVFVALATLLLAFF